MTRRLAGALGGAEDENVRRIRQALDTYLPEDVRDLLNPESPQARAERRRKETERMDAARSAREGEEERKLFQEIKSNLVVKERTWEGPTIEDIKPGYILEVNVDNDAGPYHMLYEITREPFQKEDGEWWVTAKQFYSNKTTIVAADISLGDNGVTAYSNGLWCEKRRPFRIFKKKE